MKRYLQDQIRKDLKMKMVFVAGARQVGKTTLAKQVLGKEDGYLNWDIAEQRERILKREMPTGRLWVFDEIHKYRGWRNLLKGIYDSNGPKQQVLVTGSARLSPLAPGQPIDNQGPETGRLGQSPIFSASKSRHTKDTKIHEG